MRIFLLSSPIAYLGHVSASDGKEEEVCIAATIIPRGIHMASLSSAQTSEIGPHFIQVHFQRTKESGTGKNWVCKEWFFLLATQATAKKKVDS